MRENVSLVLVQRRRWEREWCGGVAVVCIGHRYAENKAEKLLANIPFLMNVFIYIYLYHGIHI